MMEEVTLMHNLFKFGVSVIVLCAGFSQVAVATEPWRVLLEQQLLADEKCDLNYLTAVSITEKSKGKMIKARAHCNDTRRFDVLMPPGGAKFEVSACKPTYC